MSEIPTVHPYRFELRQRTGKSPYPHSDTVHILIQDPAGNVAADLKVNGTQFEDDGWTFLYEARFPAPGRYQMQLRAFRADGSLWDAAVRNLTVRGQFSGRLECPRLVDATHPCGDFSFPSGTLDNLTVEARFESPAGPAGSLRMTDATGALVATHPVDEETESFALHPQGFDRTRPWKITWVPTQAGVSPQVSFSVAWD